MRIRHDGRVALTFLLSLLVEKVCDEGRGDAARAEHGGGDDAEHEWLDVVLGLSAPTLWPEEESVTQAPTTQVDRFDDLLVELAHTRSFPRDDASDSRIVGDLSGWRPIALACVFS